MYLKKNHHQFSYILKTKLVSGNPTKIFPAAENVTFPIVPILYFIDIEKKIT